jgi:hypothetical protein
VINNNTEKQDYFRELKEGKKLKSLPIKKT